MLQWTGIETSGCGLLESRMKRHMVSTSLEWRPGTVLPTQRSLYFHVLPDSSRNVCICHTASFMSSTHTLSAWGFFICYLSFPFLQPFSLLRYIALPPSLLLSILSLYLKMLLGLLWLSPRLSATINSESLVLCSRQNAASQPHPPTNALVLLDECGSTMQAVTNGHKATQRDPSAPVVLWSCDWTYGLGGGSFRVARREWCRSEEGMKQENRGERIKNERSSRIWKSAQNSEGRWGVKEEGGKQGSMRITIRTVDVRSYSYWGRGHSTASNEERLGNAARDNGGEKAKQEILIKGISKWQKIKNRAIRV